MNKKISWVLLALTVVFSDDRLFAQGPIDPQIKTIIQKSFQNNNVLRLKSLDVDKSMLEADAVRANKLPHVSATGIYGYMHANGSLDLPPLDIPILNLGLFEGVSDFNMSTQIVRAGVSVRQALFTGLQIPNGEKALREKTNAQRFLVDASKEGIAKDIVAAFDQIMLLDQVDKLIVDSEKRLKKEQLKVNKAIENGLAIPYDRDKLKLALLELEEKKIELHGNRRLLVKKIEQDSGVPAAEIEQVIYELSPILIPELPSDVSGRAELKALDASGKAYEYLYKKERGNYLPAIFAFGSASYLNMFNTDMTIKDKPVVGDIDLKSNSLKASPNLMVGVGVKWDIFTGGERRNKLQQVKLEQVINDTKKLEAEEKLNLLLDKNRVQYNTGNQKIKVSGQQLKVAENNLEIASRQYAAGLIDVTELLASENDWYKVNLGYYSNVIQQRGAAIEILHTSGKLLQTIND